MESDGDEVKSKQASKRDRTFNPIVFWYLVNPVLTILAYLPFLSKKKKFTVMMR